MGILMSKSRVSMLEQLDFKKNKIKKHFVHKRLGPLSRIKIAQNEIKILCPLNEIKISSL
jgi:hypothetical protein